MQTGWVRGKGDETETKGMSQRQSGWVRGVAAHCGPGAATAAHLRRGGDSLRGGSLPQALPAGGAGRHRADPAARG